MKEGAVIRRNMVIVKSHCDNTAMQVLKEIKQTCITGIFSLYKKDIAKTTCNIYKVFPDLKIKNLILSEDESLKVLWHSDVEQSGSPIVHV